MAVFAQILAAVCRVANFRALSCRDDALADLKFGDVGTHRDLSPGRQTEQRRGWISGHGGRCGNLRSVPQVSAADLTRMPLGDRF
jgi:hypothetical protein